MPGMRIAAAQVHPAWLDSARGTTIVTDWIGKAADEGVELVAFGETFLGGYPLWIAMTDGARFDNADQKRAYSAYLDAAVELDGPEIATITEAVRDRGVFTYVGVAERGSGTGRGTVYCTLVAIDPKQGVVSAHRKLMPTYEERLAWGIGDGHGSRASTTARAASASAASTAGRTGCRSAGRRCTPAARTCTSRCGRAASG